MASNNQGGKQGGNQGGKQGGGSDNQDSKQSGNTSNRGFASMDPQRQREIASEGGRAAHASGNAHEFTSEEARRAGSMSHKNDGNKQSGGAGNEEGGRQDTRGGTPEQHAKAGAQSRKNEK